eukprot:scaffold5295_cov85-Isochrysis_galbana.AAC.2
MNTYSSTGTESAGTGGKTREEGLVETGNAGRREFALPVARFGAPCTRIIPGGRAGTWGHTGGGALAPRVARSGALRMDCSRRGDQWRRELSPRAAPQVAPHPPPVTGTKVGEG